MVSLTLTNCYELAAISSVITIETMIFDVLKVLNVLGEPLAPVLNGELGQVAKQVSGIESGRSTNYLGFAQAAENGKKNYG